MHHIAFASRREEQEAWQQHVAGSGLAISFAMPASTSLREPASLSRAALTISGWEASTLVAISASWKAIAWCSAICLPKVSRCWA